MPHRLPNFTHEVAEATTVPDVLHVLQTHVNGPMHVLSANLDLERPRNFIFDSSVPRNFQRDYIRISKRNDQSELIRYTLSSPLPYTFRQARSFKHSGQDLRMFELTDSHGMRDGFVSTHGPSVITFWSEEKLILPRESRYALHQIGTTAVDRLKELMPRKDRSIKLSPRELEALEHLARGLRAPEIAKRMDVSVPTVHSTLIRVRKKLKTKTLPQTTVIAVRRHLI